MSKKEPVVGQQYSIKELQEFAVAEMNKSISEHADRADPKVGTVLVDRDLTFICAAHRGELRSGDHAEFTAIEKLQNFTAPTVSRNPKLADVYYNMRYIERRGFGMEEIQKYNPKPVYSIDEVYTALTITRNVSFSIEEKQNLIDILTEKEKAVYDYLIKTASKIGRAEIAQRLEIEDKTVLRILKRLNNAGLVLSEGQGKATKYYAN